MIWLDNRMAGKDEGWTRRSILRAGGLGLFGLATSGVGRSAPAAAMEGAQTPGFGRAKSVIILFLVGAPGQIDTWDMKPDAPGAIRGPFRPVETNVPGIAICEHFPHMARHADKFAIVRSVYHQDVPIHETGHQRALTGFTFRGGVESPSLGSVTAYLKGSQSDRPPYAVLPGPIKNIGGQVPHGQTGGYLGSRFDPAYINPCSDRRWFREPESLRDRYGRNTFGQSCLTARALIQAGARFVTVNMFDSLAHDITWDCHAAGGNLSCSLDDYPRSLMPVLDTAYSALLEDLAGRGLLDETLVVCMGEFGRAPRIGSRTTRGAGAGAYGRDHWTGVWSVLVAGAGVVGGQVIGASDKVGAEPANRPVHSAEISATIYHALGIPPETELPGPSNRPMGIVDSGANPVLELYGTC
jgi:Protein of unknown function (DUF1501)